MCQADDLLAACKFNRDDCTGPSAGCSRCDVLSGSSSLRSGQIHCGRGPGTRVAVRLTSIRAEPGTSRDATSCLHCGRDGHRTRTTPACPRSRGPVRDPRPRQDSPPGGQGRPPAQVAGWRAPDLLRDRRCGTSGDRGWHGIGPAAGGGVAVDSPLDREAGARGTDSERFQCHPDRALSPALPRGSSASWTRRSNRRRSNRPGSRHESRRSAGPSSRKPALSCGRTAFCQPRLPTGRLTPHSRRCSSS